MYVTVSNGHMIEIDGFYTLLLSPSNNNKQDKEAGHQSEENQSCDSVSYNVIAPVCHGINCSGTQLLLHNQPLHNISQQ